MLNANVQWDDIWRWGLWEIIRLWRWSPYERDSCHYRYPRELLCLYRHMRTQLGNRLAVSEAGSELSPYSELQISDFPNSRLWGISCCVYKPLSQYFFYFVLLCYQPKQTCISCLGNKVWFLDSVPWRMGECGCHSKREYS